MGRSDKDQYFILNSFVQNAVIQVHSTLSLQSTLITPEFHPMG